MTGAREGLGALDVTIEFVVLSAKLVSTRLKHRSPSTYQVDGLFFRLEQPSRQEAWSGRHDRRCFKSFFPTV